MIKISIACDGKDLLDEFEHKNTTLAENALVVRALEQMKLKLLDEFEYDPKFEVASGDQLDG